MNKSITRRLAQITALFICLFPSISFAIDFSKPVKEIVVIGNDRVSQNTIRFYIRSKIGEPFSVKTSRNDIRKIYSLKYFDDIKLDIEEEKDGLKLIYKVTEKPFVKSVTFKGVKDIPMKDLVLIIKVKKGSYFLKHLMKRDIRKIKEKYQKRGFYFTEVTPIIKDVGNHEIDVVYVVKENQKIKVTEINFVGNKFLKSYQLRENMETGTIGLWDFMTDNGNYAREVIKVDRLKMEAKYRDFGFIKARIEEPRIEVDRENGRIIITFHIFEGKQYFVGDITAQGDELFSKEEILSHITLKKGDPFNQSTLRGNLFKVTEMYANKGYAYASPLTDNKEDEEKRLVNINIKIDTGDKIYIGKIDISGNEKTNDNVIRRAFRLHEGDLYNGSKMKNTRRRLTNLGFFASYDISQKSGDEPNLMDLDLSVIEKPTGNFTAGLGYNSIENLSVKFGVTEKNFMGTGRTLDFSIDTSSLREEYAITFTEPKFRDRDIFLSTSLFLRSNNLITYKTKTKGASVTVGRNLNEFTSVNLKYRLERVNLSIADIATASTFLTSQVGASTTGSLAPSYIIDTRDNYLFPTQGYRIRIGTEVASKSFGGDFNFYKIDFTAKRHAKLPFDFSLGVKTEIKYADGYDNTKLPLKENYFLGSRKVRGFRFSDIGPMDANGYSIGGNSSLLFSTELVYPFSKTISGVIFYDRGQVYGTEGDLSKTTKKKYDLENMRHSYGFGIRFITPMGPIGLTWGFKLDRKRGESPVEFNLGIGSAGF